MIVMVSIPCEYPGDYEFAGDIRWTYLICGRFFGSEAVFDLHSLQRSQVEYVEKRCGYPILDYHETQAVRRNCVNIKTPYVVGMRN